MKKMIVDEGMRDQIAWKCASEDFDFGTQLVVHESQQAVFLRNGQALEVLGPGMHILETTNLPFLNRLIAGAFGRKYFHAEVYFINHSVQMAVPWGTPERVSLLAKLDEEGSTLPLAIGASGSMNIQADPDQAIRMLTCLLGTGRELTVQNVQAMFRDMLNTAVKSHLAQVLKDINIFTLDAHLAEISRELEELAAPDFLEYGLIIRNLKLSRFMLPEEDPAFQDAKLLRTQQYSKRTKLTLEGELEMQRARIDAEKARIAQQQALIEAETKAQSTVIEARGEAGRRSLEGITSIQEHQFDTINHAIDAGAASAQSGGGTGAMGVMNDMTGMMGTMMQAGLGLQMAKETGGIMKDIMGQGLGTADQLGAVLAAPSGGWVCTCGAENTGNFCTACGKSKPTTWVCSCNAENEGNFCSNCGRPRPVPWHCPQCGAVNQPESRFCPNCGAKKE